MALCPQGCAHRRRNLFPATVADAWKHRSTYTKRRDLSQTTGIGRALVKRVCEKTLIATPLATRMRTSLFPKPWAAG